MGCIFKQTSWRILSRLIPASIFIGAMFPVVIGAQTIANEKNESFPVEYFEQMELPISVSSASVVRRESHASLTARFANRTEEGINGVAFVLILLSSQGTVKGRISWVEKLDLDAGELREVSLRLPKDINAPPRGKLVLGIDEIFGNRSIWISLKVHEALEAYCTGAPYKQPVIKRVANTVDSPPL